MSTNSLFEQLQQDVRLIDDMRFRYLGAEDVCAPCSLAVAFGPATEFEPKRAEFLTKLILLQSSPLETIGAALELSTLRGLEPCMGLTLNNLRTEFKRPQFQSALFRIPISEDQTRGHIVAIRKNGDEVLFCDTNIPILTGKVPEFVTKTEPEMLDKLFDQAGTLWNSQFPQFIDRDVMYFMRQNC